MPQRGRPSTEGRARAASSCTLSAHVRRARGAGLTAGAPGSTPAFLAAPRRSIANRPVGVPGSGTLGSIGATERAEAR
jgi:hypothetical protein